MHYYYVMKFLLAQGSGSISPLSWAQLGSLMEALLIWLGSVQFPLHMIRGSFSEITLFPLLLKAETHYKKYSENDKFKYLSILFNTCLHLTILIIF